MILIAKAFQTTFNLPVTKFELLEMFLQYETFYHNIFFVKLVVINFGD